MWNIEGSWGGSVDTLADVWLLDGERRVVTERAARRLAGAKRAERPSGRRPSNRSLDLGTSDALFVCDAWGDEFDPQLEAETLAQIADDRAISAYQLERHARNDFVESYLRFLVAEGATSLHVALVNRLMNRFSREVARSGWERQLPCLLNSPKAELVVAIRSRMVSDEQGKRLLAFFGQLRAWSWVHAEMRSGDRSIESAEAEEKAFDPALSMTRLDADLLEPALLAASRTNLDVRAAIAVLFVLETGIGSGELSALRARDIVPGANGNQFLQLYRRPARELSPALSAAALALVKQMRCSKTSPACHPTIRRYSSLESRSGREASRLHGLSTRCSACRETCGVPAFIGGIGRCASERSKLITIVDERRRRELAGASLAGASAWRRWSRRKAERTLSGACRSGVAPDIAPGNRSRTAQAFAQVERVGSARGPASAADRAASWLSLAKQQQVQRVTHIDLRVAKAWRSGRATGIDLFSILLASG
jgi:hypothetical protein